MISTLAKTQLSEREERYLIDAYLEERKLTEESTNARLLSAHSHLQAALQELSPEWRAQLIEEWKAKQTCPYDKHSVSLRLHVWLEAAHSHCCSTVQAVCVVKQREGFGVELSTLENRLTIQIKEHTTMETYTPEFSTSLTLGSINIPLRDALDLRPGDVIELSDATSLTGTLCIGDGEWLKVRIVPSDEGLELQISEHIDPNQLI